MQRSNGRERCLAAAALVALLGAGGCMFKPRTSDEPPPTMPDGGDPIIPIDASFQDLVRGIGDGSSTMCVGLGCQQATCNNGPCMVPKCNGTDKTTVSGVVHDPAGKVPLYNVTVYVPNAALKTLSEGATCDCETSISGSPLISATTNAKGEFTLVDVPVGANIPLVVQVGKWRRESTIANVVGCTNTAADDNVTRLPRNQSEGHLPKIALTTGGADALECLLRKIGLEDAEFTPEAGAGRVNLFAGGKHNGVPMRMNNQTTSAGTDAYSATLNGGAPFTDAETWWEDGANLNKYDIILHSCDGVDSPNNKSVNARAAMQAYADAGGRVFASHWHNYWIEHGPAPWPTVAQFNHRNDPANPFTSTIDTSFPKGMAMSDWLTNVGASTTPGELIIQGAKQTVQSVSADAQRWIYSPMSVQYFSFNAPLQAMNQCGKVVFSDLHVSAGTGGADNDSSAPTKPFPTGCVTTDLSPQEKALEFMLFDLSTCVKDVIIF